MKMNVKGKYVVRILYLFFISGIITSCIAKRSLVPPVTKGELENKSLSDLDPNDSINVEIDLEHEYEQDVEIRYKVQDNDGNYYSIENDKNSISRIEAFVDSQWIEIENWDLIEKEKSNCTPHDYTLILDMSGSMKKNEELISNEAVSFIKYKNEADEIAIIKYATTPILVSGFSKDGKLLTDSLLHKNDTTIGGFTKTELAYLLYNDDLKANSVNPNQSVILFSDLSGSWDEKFDSLALANKREGIQTHKVVYFPDEQQNTFFFRFIYSKDNIKRVFEPKYGKIFRVEDYKNIGASLRRIIDQNCTFNKLIFHRPENATKYRIYSQINGKEFIDKINSKIPLPEQNQEGLSNSSFTYGNDTVKVGEPILLNVYFDTGSDSLLAESNEEIERVFEILNEYPKMRIEIKGHTDNRGSLEYNADLSERRAAAVLNSLIEKGINKNRLSSKGYWYSLPIATNETPEGRAKNRRTEFVVIEK